MVIETLGEEDKHVEGAEVGSFLSMMERSILQAFRLSLYLSLMLRPLDNRMLFPP